MDRSEHDRRLFEVGATRCASVRELGLAAPVADRLSGRELFRVDLAAVVSKYIGETEKNLERLFEVAAEAGAVLVFDEADTLFGKRTEVRDAHDRYTNLDVSELLRRIEAQGGVVILTTNMKHAIDPAFLRRLRFIVDFPFPSPGR